MFARIREKFGSAGLLVAVVALVVALTGVAYAAGGLTKKQEKQVKKIAKTFAGAPGAQGPAGVKGDQGSKGEQGAKGDTGSPGAPGNDGADGEDGACSVGNSKCALPPGATITGLWSFWSQGTTGAFLNISYPLRVQPAPQFEPSTNFILPGNPTENCPGSAEEPQAAPGQLCVYVKGGMANISPESPEGVGSNTADETSGLVAEFLFANVELEGYGRGSWAVTARCPKNELEEEEC